MEDETSREPRGPKYSSPSASRHPQRPREHVITGAASRNRSSANFGGDAVRTLVSSVQSHLGPIFRGATYMYDYMTTMKISDQVTKVHLYSVKFVNDVPLENEFQDFFKPVVVNRLRVSNALMAFLAFNPPALQICGVVPDYYALSSYTIPTLLGILNILLFNVATLSFCVNHGQLLGTITGAIWTVLTCCYIAAAYLSHTDASSYSIEDSRMMYIMHLIFMFTMVQSAISMLVPLEIPNFVRLSLFNLAFIAFLVGYAVPPAESVPVRLHFCLCIPITLALCLALVRHSNQEARQTFLMKRALQLENKLLNNQLEELVEHHRHITKNENPTAQEHSAVKMLQNDPLIKSSSIAFADLTLSNQVGFGASGEVFKGKYRGMDVAVKRMLRDRIDSAHLENLSKEILMMSILKHPNIVTFIGASWDSISNICIVLEFMDRGTLRDVCTTTKGTYKRLTWLNPKIKFAIGIARAMCYLHGRTPAVIHRDLKTENVLGQRLRQLPSDGSGRQGRYDPGGDAHFHGTRSVQGTRLRRERGHI